jgi:phage internal scaffolding protein
MAKVQVPFLRTPYNYDTMAVSDETGLKCEDETLAQQNFKDECDINNIMERFGLTGELPANPLPPQYGDFSGVLDYHSALNAVLASQDAFNELPATLRARFENDLNNLIRFLDDPNNRNEAIDLGLISKEPMASMPEPSEPSSAPSGTGAQLPT